MNLLGFSLFAQENLTYNNLEQAFVETYNDDIKEAIKGSWIFTGSWGEVLNKTKYTDWIGNDNNLIGNSRWKDILSIQHTISCSFSWISPPNVLTPGNEVLLSASYINNEYSSTSKIFSGIRIVLEKGEIISDNKSSEILFMKKDNLNKNNETKLGNLFIPKYYKGDPEQILIFIDCFIGNDHYRMFYSYRWVEHNSSF